MTETMTASPTKLRDGSWGARIAADDVSTVAVGSQITVKARSGKSWTARVTKVLWTGPDRYGSGKVALVETESIDRAPRRSNGNNRLTGTHTHNHCSCGNWSGHGSPCLYGYSEAKDEGEAGYIDWS